MIRRILGRKKVDTNPQKIEELLTRGVVDSVDTQHLKKALLSGSRLRIKLGIDPTSPHLHIGRAVTLLKLADFQKLGHQIVLIVGDATGVVGDTSDKTSERPLLTKKEVVENAKTYFTQAGKLLDMSRVEKHYNSEWLLKLSYNDIGEHADAFSVADFIARENIKKRLDSGKRVSLREMLYPLMQGYDSVAVRADVEIGGSDQWFNVLAGRTLQERYKQKPQDVLTTELILGTDGRKMSSSWGNTINILDTPSDMYGKVMRIPDELIVPYSINCTRIPLSRIREIEQSLTKGDNPRDLKMELAREIVRMYHTKKEAQSAEEYFKKTVQQGEVIDAPTLSAQGGELLKEVLLREGIVSSGNEYTRLLTSGAIRNISSDTKITNTDEVVESSTYKIGKQRAVTIRLK